MGVPMIRNFECVIKSNQIRNCPVTLDDIDRAEKICRKDISHIKVKVARWNSTTTTIVNIAMPKEPKERNKNITLHIDIAHIDKIGFMTRTSHPLHCWGHQHVAKWQKRVILWHAWWTIASAQWWQMLQISEHHVLLMQIVVVDNVHGMVVGLIPASKEVFKCQQTNKNKLENKVPGASINTY